MEPDYRLILCRTCDGEGRLYRSRYGGNDPDEIDVGPCPNPDCKDGYELAEVDLVTIKDLEMEDAEQ